MTNFRTTIELTKSSHSISHKSNILLAGSCFADNMVTRLAERKFNIGINPFGVLYNPLSISAMLMRIIEGKPFTAESPELVEHNGKWHSMLHHGDFSRNTKEELLDMYIVDHTSKSFMPELLDFEMYDKEKPVAAMTGCFLNATFKKAK